MELDGNEPEDEFFDEEDRPSGKQGLEYEGQIPGVVDTWAEKDLRRQLVRR